MLFFDLSFLIGLGPAGIGGGDSSCGSVSGVGAGAGVVLGAT